MKLLDDNRKGIVVKDPGYKADVRAWIWRQRIGWKYGWWKIIKKKLKQSLKGKK